MYVKKAAGDIEPYSRRKLKRFLEHIQLPSSEINKTISRAESKLAKHSSTKQISHAITDELRALLKGELYSARYNIKNSIRKMGPAGHVFEKYVARLFELDGFKVEVGREIQGDCVKHEIDVLARRENEVNLVECKFHNKEGTRSDVTVAMYTFARFLDVSKRIAKSGREEYVWIVTNTKITNTAFRYAKCKGMRYMSIGLPEGNSIMDRVIEKGAFPISSIHVLEPHLSKLFTEDVIMMSDIMDVDNEKANQLGIPIPVLNTAHSVAESILGSIKS